MAETIQRKLNDSPAARWTALLLIASTMFFGYMFVDLMSPLQSMIEAQRGWTPDVFGMYGSSEFILNQLLYQPNVIHPEPSRIAFSVTQGW